MSTPQLCIRAAGMCCAVGHSAPAASAAMGAAIDHFRTSWFEARDGSPVPCATVFGLDAWGPERMGALFRSVLAECRAIEAFEPAETALLLLVPDPQRPGAEQDWPQEIYEFCTGELAFHESSRICPWDRAGLGLALIHARTLLTSGTVKRVLVAGVDSLLNAVTINALLEQERLLVRGVPDGCIPGEGAGAVLLGLEPKETPCVRVCGVGVGFEPGHMLQDEVPNRCTGLTEAIRAAVAESGSPLTDMRFHLTDGNGNTYYAKESAMTMARVLEHPVPNYPFVLPATYFGETGAAVGPLMLAYLVRYMPRERLPYGLVHSSADNGRRCAVLVSYS